MSTPVAVSSNTPICLSNTHHLIQSDCYGDRWYIDTRPQDNKLPQNLSNSLLEHMQDANSVLVCKNGHIYDAEHIDKWEAECIKKQCEPVCPTCNADLLHANLRKPYCTPHEYPVHNQTQSLKCEFNVDLPFYKGNVFRAHHLQNAEIEFDMDTTYYNGAPRSQTYRTGTRVNTAKKKLCIIF
jgi:hypothetical protein